MMTKENVKKLADAVKLMVETRKGGESDYERLEIQKAVILLLDVIKFNEYTLTNNYQLEGSGVPYEKWGAE